MTFAFYLKDKHATTTPLVLVISHGGHKYKKQIGISVKPSEFKKQRTKDESVNAKLRGIEICLNERLNQFSKPDEILAAIEAALSGGTNRVTSKRSGKKDTPSRPSFWEYFQSWAERESTTKRSRKLAYNNIAKFMGKKDDWEDIDSAFHYRLVQRMNDEGFSVNYKWRNVQYLKTVLNEGLKLKYHKNDDFRLWDNPKEETDSVYLTEQELEQLAQAKLNIPLLAKARDLFILGVYTAARFSDYSRLDMQMIKNGIIHFTQQKTSASVMVPASPRVLEILERYGGHAPALSQQQFNKGIKDACMLAGITDLVEVTRSHGDKHTTTKEPKYKLVSSHTARRTGATLLFQSGIPAAQCMMLTGHTTEAMFMKYIKTTKEENAEMLKGAAFFQ